MAKEKFKLTDEMRDALYDGAVTVFNGMPRKLRSDAFFLELVRSVWTAAEVKVRAREEEVKPSLTLKEISRLKKEGEELRRELERRVAPMKRVSATERKARIK